MDPIKKAFNKVRSDIDFLKEDLSNLRNEVSETRKRMIEICEIIKKTNNKIEEFVSTHKSSFQTNYSSSSTHKTPLEAPKSQNLPISTGNEGVSTDRQTDRQTHRQTKQEGKNKENSFENALEILNSLDNIKKEIRLKFKRLTEQEILIFSTIYQIEEEKGYADYKQVSQKLNLTESSVRDYVGRLIAKDIPLDKKKINNKQIHLFVSKNLKKIAPLSTILQLRDL